MGYSLALSLTPDFGEVSIELAILVLYILLPTPLLTYRPYHYPTTAMATMELAQHGRCGCTGRYPPY